MMETLEAHVDAAVGAALEAHPRDELPTLVKNYLADAHAIEEQAIRLLERAPKLVEDSELEAVLDDHLAETRDHVELVQSRLTALGGDSSSLKDAAMRLGALNWASFFQGHPGHAGKARRVRLCLRAPGDRPLRATQARRGCRRRPRNARTVDKILGEERNAASSLARMFDAAPRRRCAPSASPPTPAETCPNVI